MTQSSKLSEVGALIETAMRHQSSAERAISDLNYAISTLKSASDTATERVSDTVFRRLSASLDKTEAKYKQSTQDLIYFTENTRKNIEDIEKSIKIKTSLHAVLLSFSIVILSMIVLITLYYITPTASDIIQLRRERDAIQNEIRIAREHQSNLKYVESLLNNCNFGNNINHRCIKIRKSPSPFLSKDDNYWAAY